MSYSGWKGGEKYTTVEQVRAKHPEFLIEHAVKGMIPKNRLGRVLLTKLKVFKGPKHNHEAQTPAVLAPPNNFCYGHENHQRIPRHRPSQDRHRPCPPRARQRQNHRQRPRRLKTISRWTPSAPPFPPR